jgi:hypothetical protein
MPAREDPELELDSGESWAVDGIAPDHGGTISPS